MNTGRHEGNGLLETYNLSQERIRRRLQFSPDLEPYVENAVYSGVIATSAFSHRVVPCGLKAHENKAQGFQPCALFSWAFSPQTADDCDIATNRETQIWVTLTSNLTR